MVTYIGGTVDIKRNWSTMHRTIDLHNGQNINVRLLCADVWVRDALKRHLDDAFKRLTIGFVKSKLEVTTICGDRTTCSISQIEDVLTEAKHHHDFQIFVYQFGQRLNYEDYKRRCGPCVVKNPLNEWDVTINLKRVKYGIVMCQRRRYAG